MDHVEVFRSAHHLNIWIQPDSYMSRAIETNVHVIVDHGRALVLDPGGHADFLSSLEQILSLPEVKELDYVFLSHQDPDVLSATNGWLMSTEAKALISSLWMRFLPHFGIDEVLSNRVLEIPDEGDWIELGVNFLVAIPAHFLHSCGNFQLYDKRAKVLYSGDLGASFEAPYRETKNFLKHRAYVEPFHQRYMASNEATAQWAKMVNGLEIDAIVPQHGAIMRGPAVKDFIEWTGNLKCGLDLMEDTFKVPPRALVLKTKTSPKGVC